MPRKIDVMLDLETLDNKVGAVITQLGAAQFDRTTGVVGYTFLTNINAVSCVNRGMTIGADTVMWWLAQEKAAQESLLTPEPIAVERALHHFTEWLVSLRTAFDDKYRLWCHASFDFPILQRAYELCDMKPIWHYRDYVDLRTLVDLSNINIKNFMNDDVAHNALNDCLFEIRYAVEAVKKLTPPIDPDISP